MSSVEIDGSVPMNPPIAITDRPWSAISPDACWAVAVTSCHRSPAPWSRSHAANAGSPLDSDEPNVLAAMHF